MKPIVKNLLIAGALTLVGLSLLASEKIDNLIAIFDKMTIKPNSVPKNIKLLNPNKFGIPQTLSFDIDIILKNPTGEDFAASGYIADLTKVNVYYKEKFLGSANVNINEISVPKTDTLILYNIPIQVQTLNILSNAAAITNININDLIFTGTIEVLGIEYEIGN